MISPGASSWVAPALGRQVAGWPLHWGPCIGLFDFLVGEELAAYPQLAEFGDKLDHNFTTHHILQKENARQWMAEQKNETVFFAFATDIWDFRHEGGMEFFDTLIIAVHEGQILGFQRFAECPY